MGPERKEDGLNISYKRYIQEGREEGAEIGPHPLSPRTIQETMVNSFFPLTRCTSVSGYIAPRPKRISNFSASKCDQPNYIILKILSKWVSN